MEHTTINNTSFPLETPPKEQEAKKLAKIPASEWIALGIGIAFFITAQIALFAYGFTNLLINTIASVILASIINYGLLGVKHKFQKAVSALAKIAEFIGSIPIGIGIAIYNILSAIGQFIVAIPNALITFIRAIPALFKGLGVVLLNIVLIPLIVIYFTIYGMIFSLSGSTAKIMLSHYDALGRRMLKPFEKYLHLEAIVAIVVVGIVLYVATLVLAGIQTGVSITASDTAYAAAGNGLTAMGTIASYAPILLIVIIIGAIIYLLHFFRAGLGAYAAA